MEPCTGRTAAYNFISEPSVGCYGRYRPMLQRRCNKYIMRCYPHMRSSTSLVQHPNSSTWKPHEDATQRTKACISKKNGKTQMVGPLLDKKKVQHTRIVPRGGRGGSSYPLSGDLYTPAHPNRHLIRHCATIPMALGSFTTNTYRKAHRRVSHEIGCNGLRSARQVKKKKKVQKVLL